MQKEKESKIDAIVTATMRDKKIPGMTLGIIENRELVFARAYGVTNLNTQQPLQPDALFHLASVTKLFVATALMQLRERGQLDLDAPVLRYLPYFKLNDARVPEITIRQLMMHYAGMPDTDEYGWENPEYDDGALERYVRGLENEVLIAAPNEKYFYSNIAYEVLGDVIAKVSGTTFEEVVAQNILKPLQMNNSTCLITEADKTLLTSPHTCYVDGEPTANVMVSSVFPYHRAHAPSSTLYSNIFDMNRFARMYSSRGELDGARILQKETVEEMWTPAREKNGTYWSRIGLTWNIGERHGTKIVGHLGEDVGFTSLLVLFPEREMGFIYLCNLDGDWLQEAEEEIFELMLSE